MKNLGAADRTIRILLAEVSLLIGFFWVSREWQILAYLVAAVLLIQAATGFCSIYRLLGIDTCERVKRKRKGLTYATLALVLAVAAIGSYGSAMLTEKAFVGDFSELEKLYNQTLQYTGQEARESSIAEYDRLTSALESFEARYSQYRPLPIKFDDRFEGDLSNASAIIEGARDDIHDGSLTVAHQKLEGAGPIFQEILRRNHLSLGSSPQAKVHPMS